MENCLLLCFLLFWQPDTHVPERQKCEVICGLIVNVIEEILTHILFVRCASISSACHYKSFTATNGRRLKIERQCVLLGECHLHWHLYHLLQFGVQAADYGALQQAEAQRNGIVSPEWC